MKLNIYFYALVNKMHRCVDVILLHQQVRPGDRIEVTGIFRAVPHRSNPHMRTVKSIYKTYIDAIHFRRAEQGEDNRLAGDPDNGMNIDRTTEQPVNGSGGTGVVL